jgi:hypothetical protein
MFHSPLLLVVQPIKRGLCHASWWVFLSLVWRGQAQKAKAWKNKFPSALSGIWLQITVWVNSLQSAHTVLQSE